MPNSIIGRTNEVSKLERLFRSNKSEFLAIYGRRRVGKTFLIKRYFEKQDCVFFVVSGQHKGTLREQLANFTRAIEKAFYKAGTTTLKEPTSWVSAFEVLNNLIKEYAKNRKIILFMDELPWLVTKKSRLLEALDYYWNNEWVDQGKIKLIVCGSAASWMIKKIVHNKAGLHNRLTKIIALEPFDLRDTKNFLHQKGIKLNNSQIAAIYMVTGGIPMYLNHIEKGFSSSQNIDKLCFTKNGLLFDEFDKLFSSLFERSEIHEELIRIIAKSHKGIKQADLLKKAKLAPSGGRTKHYLEELEAAGFIISFIPYQHKKRGVYYQVIDEFTLFYLYWIEPSLKTVRKLDKTSGYWASKTKTPKWQVWAGYAFEAMCYNHIAQIRKKLKIEAGAEVGTWRYMPEFNSEEKGVQIDLLFDRDDDVVTLCEIKYTKNPFIIDKIYYQNLLNKEETFRKVTRTKKQIFTAIISANGLKKTIYSEEIVTELVMLDDLFQVGE